MKPPRILSLILVGIGIGLFFTQNFWVPPLIRALFARETPPAPALEVMIATTTTPTVPTPSFPQ